MKKKISLRLLLMLIFIGSLTLSLKAEAAEGNIEFGSEQYSWRIGDNCPIGVYVNGDADITSYEVCLRYDPEKIEYIDGASSQEGDLLYIRGTGNAVRHRIMLHFRPLQTGRTEIEVISATCVFAGEETSVEIDRMENAPIAVYTRTASNRLTELKLSDGELGFSPDSYEYAITLDYETERLDVEYFAEDEQAEVEVSDAALSVGNNQITLTVHRNTLPDAVYILHVYRRDAAPAPTAAPTAEPTAEPRPTWQEQPTAQPDSELPPEEEKSIFSFWEIWETGVIQNFVLTVSVLAVIVLAIIYYRGILQEKKKNREKEEEEKRRNKRKKRGKTDDDSVINLEQTVIKVSHVTMKFRMAQEEPGSLKEYFIRTVKGKNQHEYLTALNDISLEIKQGDVVGIIGTNGSGKSTLLKIISGALPPTAGHVEVDKSKVQILTLGTGFDMELTARENVYLNGAIIGYTKEYIDENYNDIVAFAELEGFMEEKMKNFSSGMVSRLGFAIATMRDAPDILILDEVLSVGDMFFKQKSGERIQKMIHSGATVLIVSHSMGAIIQNCNKAVWIEKGVLQMTGNPKQVCDAYQKYEAGQKT